VDWGEFSRSLDLKLSDLAAPLSLEARVHRFNEALLRTGHEVVGKVRPGRRSNDWSSPEIDRLIRQRNVLRRNLSLGDNRERWLQVCAEVRLKVQEAKEKRWRDFLEGISLQPGGTSTVRDDDEERGERHTPDLAKAWRVIRSLSGTPDTGSPNIALRHNDRLITSDLRKADVFVAHYAHVSRLCFTREERATNRMARKLLGSPSVDDSSCSPFGMAELESAIRSVRVRGAAGPDDIPPTFLKALGPSAKRELLAICCQSFAEGRCPQVWRRAIIIPILKKNKPASDMSSYRPVSLTSCVGKLVERLVYNRLYHLAESRSWIPMAQAGFRAQRGCEDQILWLAQQVSDGFQQCGGRSYS
jgi:hypothetical protein